MVAPEFLQGVSLSDHWSFWQHGFPAIMVTDTAFLRNPNYHERSDTPKSLDYETFSRVVSGIDCVVEQLAN